MLQALIGPVTGSLTSLSKIRTRKMPWLTKSQPWPKNRRTKLRWLRFKLIQSRRNIRAFLSQEPDQAIMWICAIAMAYHFILQPFLLFGVLVAGVTLPADPPELDMGQLMPVLLGILGLGGMRSWEKVKGCARDNLKK
jgi:hypothetical protein